MMDVSLLHFYYIRRKQTYCTAMLRTLYIKYIYTLQGRMSISEPYTL